MMITMIIMITMIMIIMTINDEMKRNVQIPASSNYPYFMTDAEDTKLTNLIKMSKIFNSHQMFEILVQIIASVRDIT